MPRRRNRRSFRRIGLPPLVAGLFFVFFLLSGGARQFTDYLFFQEVDLTKVWGTLLSTQALLVIGFGLVFFVVLWGNLVLADRFAPTFRPLGPGDEIVARYREIVGAQASRLRIGVAALFAIIAGTSAAGEWNNWLLFRHAQSFGSVDPIFKRDLGFYVFRLPFLEFVVGWLFMAVLVTFVFTAVAHYLNGGIRLAPAALDRFTPQVRVHLSALLAALALVKALGYFVQRYTLLFSTRGFVQGATYTDVKAQLPAINLLMFISVVAFVLLLVNTRRRGWTLPGVAVGLWLVLSIVVGAIYPALVQAISVNPAENEKERPYIARNIKATRSALGIEGVAMQRYEYTDDLTADELQANSETIRNVRLWDPKVAKNTYQSLQSIRAYYEFNDVDADRYMLDGKLTQVLTSVRDLNPAGLPDNGSWVNRHLQYTHGYGAVVSPANAVTADGNPSFTVKDVPPVGEPKITQPRVYYGENLGGYAIVRSKQRELDYSTTSSRYDGKGGVPLSSFVRKAALALRFGEKNLVISNRITPESRAIYYRDIDQRVRKAAPFLRYDNDPYAVVVDGRIVWVIDAYTTSNHFPYGQAADTSRLAGGSGLKRDFNYVRNSVKVTVDAFDGNMRFYRVDATDPVASAYAKAFPKLFTPASQMSDNLRAHLRYPEDLFKVQTSMFARYHLTKPDEFFNASDAWNVARDPFTGQLRSTSRSTSTTLPVLPSQRDTNRMEPYYVVTRLPNDKAPTFQILQPFTPASKTDERRNLTAFMVAKSDPGNYGKLEAFVMPTGQQVAGPSVVGSEMQADQQVSSIESLLGNSGSEVIRGNIVMLPVGRSIIAVRPMYVQAEGQKFPQLRKVIVWQANRVRVADTLSGALTALFGAAPETLEGAPPIDSGEPQTPPSTETIADLLKRAETAFAAADKALRDGDLAAYQRNVAEARDLIRRAQAASSRPSTTTTTAPSTAA